VIGETSPARGTADTARIRKENPVILGEFGAFDLVEKTFGEAVQSMAQVRALALVLGPFRPFSDLCS
jgi:hypothetical protein